MPIRPAFAIVCAWLACTAFAAGAQTSPQAPGFEPARAIAIQEITIPDNSIAMGTAVLEVAVSAEGGVSGVEVRRDAPSVTQAAVRSVRAWKFQPARRNGWAVSSLVTVAVTFNPLPPLAEDRSSLPPPARPENAVPGGANFTPPGVSYAAFAVGPFNAVWPGTVVLQATLDAAGSVEHITVLQDAPPFTAASRRALDRWRFTPATAEGRPVESNVVAVFCFRQPWGFPTRP